MSRGLIILNSFDKKNYEDEQNIRFEVNLQDDLNAVALSSFDFTYGFCNVNSRNNTAYIDDGATTYPVTLLNGFYDYPTFLTEMKTRLDALGLGAFGITFTDNIYAMLAPVPIQFKNNFLTAGRDWVDMAGFTKETPLNVSHVGGTANIAYTDAIYIICEELHRRQTMNDANTRSTMSNVLGVVYVNENRDLGSDKIAEDINRPRHITTRMKVLKWINKDPNNSVGVFTIRLVDAQGLPLPLKTDGCGSVGYTMELMVKNNSQVF